MAKQPDFLSTTAVPLSVLIRDRWTRAAFERAERDRGEGPAAAAMAALPPHAPMPLAGAAECELPEQDRERIAAAIEAHLDAAEALIAQLDRADGDPDFCASEHDGIEPDADEEPSLGWTGDLNQTKALWTCRDGGKDMEAEHDGREPDEADLEPSLGWCIGGSWGSNDDREMDCEDEGACETALDVL